VGNFLGVLGATLSLSVSVEGGSKKSMGSGLLDFSLLRRPLDESDEFESLTSSNAIAAFMR